jgi:hypothetical protein
MTLPSCSAQHHGILALLIGVDPDFLNHAPRGRPAENGLICDDDENS